MATETIYHATRRRPAHADLVYRVGKIPVYLNDRLASLHKGAKVITKIRLGDYVDEEWQASRNLVVRRPNHTCSR